MAKSKSPILLITYKRLDTTKKVIASIKKYAPAELFIFSDGPKTSKDSVKVEKVRNFITASIDWPCEVSVFFSDKNLGCKYGPQEAISWFFQSKDKGIILEDDTVPDLSFYMFCDELLDKYYNDLRIWNIGGTNSFPNHLEKDEFSYRFSKFPHTWGWATWADRWSKHMNSMPNFMNDLKNPVLKSTFSNKSILKNWKHKAKISHLDQLDAWDYLWSFKVFMNNGLSIMPKSNLISNIGFGDDATHTFGSDASIQNTSSLEFPLNHPRVMVPNIEADEYFFEEYFNWKTTKQKAYPKHFLNAVMQRLKKTKYNVF